MEENKLGKFTAETQRDKIRAMEAGRPLRLEEGRRRTGTEVRDLRWEVGGLSFK